jgi:UDP-sugar transporter A1/2/3
MSNSVLKSVVLVLLVVQNCALILFMKYSIRANLPEEERFLPVVAVTLNELLKFVACSGVLLCKGEFSRGVQEAFGDVQDYLLTCVPALLYFVQNNLLYFAVARLDTVVFQVSYQLKILTTACFSVIMLKRRLGRLQWFALFLLIPGVALVQISSNTAHVPITPSSAHMGKISSDSDRIVAQNIKFTKNYINHVNLAPNDTSLRNLTGLLSVLAACITSGFAGVYFELVLKNKKGSMWSRNLQLSSGSFLIGCLSAAFTKYQTIAEKGLFHGLGPAAWCTIGLQAVGGLVVAAVVKYADNIVKAFATSVSILLSCFLSYFLFGWKPNRHFVTGALLVGISVYFYSSEAGKQKKVFDAKAIKHPTETCRNV